MRALATLAALAACIGLAVPSEAWSAGSADGPAWVGIEPTAGMPSVAARVVDVALAAHPDPAGGTARADAPGASLDVLHACAFGVAAGCDASAAGLAGGVGLGGGAGCAKRYAVHAGLAVTGVRCSAGAQGVATALAATEGDGSAVHEAAACVAGPGGACVALGAVDADGTTCVFLLRDGAPPLAPLCWRP